MSAANGDVKLAEKGIVFIDEIDKLASPQKENMSITADPGRTGVQQALLKMIEGYTVEVTEKGQRKHPEAPVTRVDTTNILFIFGGAFVGLEDIIKKRINKKSSSLGFTSKKSSKEEKEVSLKQVINDDLRDFGLIPEFIGRIPVNAVLNDLTEEDLMKILTEPKNAIVKQYKELLKLDNIELDFTEEALLEIAKLAIKKKTGARSLRSVIEPFITRISFKLANENNKRLLVKFNKNTIINNEEPIVEEAA